MQFTISDQRPAVLNAIHTIPIIGDYDPLTAMRKVIAEPLFDPLPGRTVSVVDDKGTPYDEDAVLEVFMQALSGTISASAEKGSKSLLTQGLVHFDPSSSLLTNEAFAIQAGAASKLPAPTPRVLYTAGSDVIPAAKALLASQDEPSANALFASLAYTYSPETLGFWFLGNSSFQDFLTWFDQRVQALGNLPVETMGLLQQFRQLTLTGLTESLILRKDDSDQLQENSFARVLVYLLMQYSDLQRNQAHAQAGTPMEAGVMPFVMTELFLPRTLVFMNVETHARATARRVDKEWKLINQSLNSPVKVISTAKLARLTALSRAAAKATAAAVQAGNTKQNAAGRSAKIIFRKQAPTSVDILTGLMRVLKRMKQVNRSQNVLRTQRKSFVKANRRDPMDFNKPGTLTSQVFLPDLHVFVDTSGSISEANYQQAIMMLIKLAKKLNVNLYFSSFSHIMSQEVLLKTAGKSVTEIWKEFQRIPKVAGGTEYEQIWRYINANPVRRRRLSLIVSDFEWRARSHRVEHPKNLYYAPCSNMDWDRMRYHAKGFADSVQHIEPTIGGRLIGITA